VKGEEHSPRRRHVLVPGLACVFVFVVVWASDADSGPDSGPDSDSQSGEVEVEVEAEVEGGAQVEAEDDERRLQASSCYSGDQRYSGCWVDPPRWHCSAAHVDPAEATYYYEKPTWHFPPW
jgi:hypothetical protein